MFKRLVSLWKSYLEVLYPKELETSDLNLDSFDARPRSVRLTCGAWTHLELHTRCTDSRVQELQNMGARVYAFTDLGNEDQYIWVESTKLDSLISICREYQFTHPLHTL
jgi:hypothetical protein